MKGNKIILGVTGSIAAYKSAYLIRLFVKNGCEVQVIMTDYARNFITPLTLSTLSNRPVLVDGFDMKSGEWHSHIDIGMWGDVYLIAPATANTIAKLANGICDNLLCAVYLAARCQVFIAPAMDADMYKHSVTQYNIKKLEDYGVKIIKPQEGELASGLIDVGRMEEPDNILKIIKSYLINRNGK